MSLRTAFLVSASSLALAATSTDPAVQVFPDPSGLVQTLGTAGPLDAGGPFFQDLGTNRRSCASCHQARDGWSVAPRHLQARFLASDGMDPVFRPVDGAVCPSADVGSLADRHAAYAMLLDKGLIRVSLPMPDSADFVVTGAADPHACPETTTSQLALFRRPLPATNLPFLTTVMWDGRESPAGRSLTDDLTHQAIDATLGHAQATQPPTDAELQAIVGFETATFTAQVVDAAAGFLGASGARGGAVPLSRQTFFVGINDPLGGNPTGAAFDPVAFTLFSRWQRPVAGGDEATSRTAARLSVARGETLFNSLPITISGVGGLNDKPGVPASFTGSCTTCHDAPNVGHHSVPLAINIGVTDYPALPALDTAGLPVYSIECDAGAATPPGKGRSFQTTDPGRALVTGKCADVGKTKGPILRALAARAPYFHNGSARTLRDAIEFYDQRFKLSLTEQQKRDLVAFLATL